MRRLTCALLALAAHPALQRACMQMLWGEENKKLNAEIAELRTLVDDANATLNSLAVGLANTQAELAALRGPPSPVA